MRQRQALICQRLGMVRSTAAWSGAIRPCLLGLILGATGAAAGQVSVLPPVSVIPPPAPAPVPPAPVAPGPVETPAAPSLPQIAPGQVENETVGRIRIMDVTKLSKPQAEEALGLITEILNEPAGLSPAFIIILQRKAYRLRILLEN